MKSVNKEYMLSPETCDLVADSVSEFCDKSNVENKDAIIATALVIDLITDFSVTAFEVGVLPMTLIGVSSQMSLLDKDVLKKEL